MSYAPFASGKILSPNCYSGRSYDVCKFTPHHMAGSLTAAQCGTLFQNPGRQASSNYGIGNDGELICYVEDEDTAWTSSSYWNDSQAITVEVANTVQGVYNDTWDISAAAWETLVKLGVYVCQKYGFRLEYTGDRYGSLTEHRMFAPTGCPGPYLHARMGLLAEVVNSILDGGGGMATAEEVWAYTNKALEGNKDAYQILRDARDAAVRAEAAAKKASTGGVDVDAIATAVADKIAARMKA